MRWSCKRLVVDRKQVTSFAVEDPVGVYTKGRQHNCEAVIPVSHAREAGAFGLVEGGLEGRIAAFDIRHRLSGLLACWAGLP
ncbi:hypothetical protein JCM9533A_76390 [Catenuloplanes niger JCM 9533]